MIRRGRVLFFGRKYHDAIDVCGCQRRFIWMGEIRRYELKRMIWCDGHAPSPENAGDAALIQTFNDALTARDAPK